MFGGKAQMIVVPGDLPSSEPHGTFACLHSIGSYRTSTEGVVTSRVTPGQSGISPSTTTRP